MLKSTCENSLWYRLVIFFVGLSFLFWLNFLLFAPFMWIKYWYVEVFLILFLWLFLYFLIKFSKYIYTIKDEKLLIKSPYKFYKIPLSDIEKVWEIDKIPFSNKFWMKFDSINKILYLCWFVDKWIILKLKTHDIVICPRKFDDFFKLLKEKKWYIETK